jgi:hypothetical protein
MTSRHYNLSDFYFTTCIKCELPFIVIRFYRAEKNNRVQSPVPDCFLMYIQSIMSYLGAHSPHIPLKGKKGFKWSYVSCCLGARLDSMQPWKLQVAAEKYYNCKNAFGLDSMQPWKLQVAADKYYNCKYVFGAYLNLCIRLFTIKKVF